MKLLYALTIFHVTISLFSADCYLKQSGGKYVLGNNYLKVMINAESGGRVEQFTDLQTGKELTTLKLPAIAPQGSGLCGERFSSKSSGSDRGFEKMPYTVSASQAKPNIVKLSLTATSNGVRIEKTFFLKKHKASLGVTYSITNLRKKNIIGRLWGVNTIVPGKNTKLFNLYFPYGGYSNNYSDFKGTLQHKVLNYPVGSNPKHGHNHVINNPVFGWIGVLNAKGNGAVIELDYANLDRLYSFLPTPDGYKVPTIEWFTRRFELKPIEKGKKEAAARPELTNPLKDYIYKTDCRIMPLIGLPEIAACNNGIAVGIEQKGAETAIYLCADRKLSGITMDIQVVGKNKKLHAPVTITNVTLLPGKPNKIKLKAAALTIADKLISLTIKNASGASVASMLIPRFTKAVADKFLVQNAAKKDHSFDPMEDAGELGNNFETTCIDWGKSLRKRIKVLAIYPKANHRELAELARRFNLDLSYVEVKHPHVFGFSRSPFVSWQIPEPAEALKKKLTEKYDSILIGGGLLWSRIPEELRNELLKKIKNGTGLVFVNPARSRTFVKNVSLAKNNYMTRGIPVKHVPGLNKYNSLKDVVKTGHLGKGKVVLFKYNTIPFGKLWRTGPRGIVASIENDKNSKIPYWEYYLSLAGRAIRHVSGDEPQLQIASASIDHLSIENAGASTNAQLKINVFNKKWQQVATIEKTVKLESGNNNISLAIPQDKLIMAGDYYFNIFLTKNNTTYDWFSFVKTINKSSHIDRLILTKIAYPTMDEDISGTCFIKGPAEGKLRISINDIYGRVIAQKTYQADNNQLSFSLTPNIAPLSILCSIRAELIVHDNVIDAIESSLTFNIPHQRDVKFIIWGSGEGNHWTKRLELKQLRRIGFDWCTGFNVSSCNQSEADAVAFNVLAASMRYIPLDIHRLVVKHTNLKERVRNPCLRDPAYLKKMQSDVSKYASWSKGFFPPYYFVADENSLGYYSQAHDFCFGPFCMTEFRKSLQKQYGTLTNLNKAWQCDFKEWNEVIPSTYSEAKKSSKWASWMDHRRFMFSALGEAVAEQHNVLKKLDPLAGLAVSGMGQPLLHNGFDWYDMEKNLDLTVAYLRESGRVMDPMRSFLKPKGMLSAWNGYGVSYETLNWKNWHQVINSFYSPAFWYIGYLVNHGDSSISECGKDMQKIIKSIRTSGVGKLLMESSRSSSEIGMLYSTSSLIATGISGANGFINTIVYNANLDGWSGIIRDSGFQPPRYVSREQLLAGGLLKTNIKVFILPLSQSLGDREVEALKAFVNTGGVLIADAVPGIYKLNGNTRNTNSLFNLFGCEYSNKGLGRLNQNISLPNSKSLPLTAASKHIKATTSKALASAKNTSKTVQLGNLKISSSETNDTIPAFLINKYGKGTAVYLNTLLHEYDGFRTRSNQSKAVTKAICNILKDAGIQPPTVSLPTGSELVRFSLGNTRVVAMTRLPRANANDSQFKISLNEAAYVYDIRQKQLLGKSEDITGTLKPGEAKVFAMLPQPIENLSLAVTKTDKGISFEVSMLNASSVIRTQLTDPDGKHDDHYARNWQIKGGKCNGTINLGMNERHGKWTLTITDTISGKTMTKIINFN